ncbi:hypothetical protein LTR09_008379 [Extremus antarcticus]|uniref:Large ribosomal subunit protein uL3m n=1 Tax=Extremus antarcticus TaxID=702011 RepID=A0AAJ0DHI6_9PEZI|nr:hypothetical protein LTR09_008379 [Extremus antarcticus]
MAAEARYPSAMGMSGSVPGRSSLRAPPSPDLDDAFEYTTRFHLNTIARIITSIMSSKGIVRLFSLPPRFLCPAVPRHFIRSIKTIHPGKTNSRFNYGHHLPILGSSSTAAFLRKEPMLPLRTGALAIKKGMTGVYDPETAKRVPCTVLQLDRCQVISHKRRDKHGYWAVQVGSGTKEARNVTRPERGHFAAHEVPIKEHTAEFRVKNEEGLPVIGSVISADLFKEGQFVDTRAVTRGMGFAGGMKRWGFSGQPASHGTSLTHRAMGSAGASQGSGSRVLPGKKMAGRLGGEMHTVQNLKVMKVDAENGFVVVHGAVPGPKNSMVKIQDAIKKPWPEIEATIGLIIPEHAPARMAAEI